MAVRVGIVAGLLLAAGVAAGCYRSHQRGGPDAGPVDAGTGRDVPPDRGGRDAGSTWVLEERPATLTFVPGTCGAPARGSTANVRATVSIEHACEAGGPVTFQPLTESEWVVQAFVWVDRRAAPGSLECPFVSGVVDRDLPIPVEGPTRVRDTVSGSTVEIEVVDDSHACSMLGEIDEPCSLNCDCRAGLICIPSVEFPCGRCGEACDLLADIHRAEQLAAVDQECADGRSCRGDGKVVARRCVDRLGDACFIDDDCPAGQRCAPSAEGWNVCVYTFDLDAARRHSCTGDFDCDEGLRCLELDSGGQRCELLCAGARMLCPSGRRCVERARDGARWVCE